MRVQVVITLRRSAQVALSVALCLTLAAPTAIAAAPAADPPGTIALGAGEDVPGRTAIWGVSDTWVVYGVGPTYSATSLRDGHTVTLAGHGLTTPSLAGGMVVLPHDEALDWIDLDTGESGTAPLAADTFLHATPSGWLLGNRTTSPQFVDGRTGAASPIATPADWVLLTSRVGPLGVVLDGIVGSGGAIGPGTYASEYVTYTDPGATPLTVPASCAIVTSVDVVCSSGTNVSVVPLDGSGAVTWPLPDAGRPSLAGAGGARVVAATSTRIGWITPDGRFHTADTHGNNQLDSPMPVDAYWATSDAFLSMSGTTSADAGIYHFPDIGAAPTLVAPLGAGTLTGLAIAIGPGSVAWSDNASARGAVWKASIRASAGFLVAGPRAPVSFDASAFMTGEGFLATSGRRTVYGGQWDLQLFERGTTSTLIHLTSGSPIHDIQLSGSRLLVTRQPTTTVMDVRTRATLFTARDLYSPALVGSYLAFARSDGSLWRKDLVTGRLLALRPAVKHSLLPPIIAMRGDVVAWQFGSSLYHRNARTLAAPIRLPSSEVLVGLTGAGILTSTDDARGFRVLLRHYNSQTATTVFSHADFGPDAFVLKVGGSALAWLDNNQHGHEPKVTPLPAGPDRPQLLGNALVPRASTATHTWIAEWDTSAPLTSCVVQLVYGRTTVRTLACDPAGMAVGVATVTWNGTGRTARAVRGHVAWRLLAGNHSGSALAVDGRPVAITGPLTSR